MKKIIVLRLLFRLWSTETEEPKKVMQRGTTTEIRNRNHWSHRRSFACTSLYFESRLGVGLQ